MKALKLLVSPAALCIWAICICVGFSIGGSFVSRTVSVKDHNRFGEARASFPIPMKRQDEALFNLLRARADAEIAGFLANAKQDGEARSQEDEAPVWT